MERNGPPSSWVKVTTPSTLEVPLRTATAFLVAATMVRGLEEARGEKVEAERLRETPRKEEVRVREEVLVGLGLGKVERIGWEEGGEAVRMV